MRTPRRGGTENKSRRYGTLGITYFYATGSLFITSNERTDGWLFNRAHSETALLFARPRAAAVLSASLLAGEKRPIRAFTAGINIAHCPRQRDSPRLNAPPQQSQSESQPAPTAGILYNYSLLSRNEYLDLGSAHTKTNIHSELCTFCVRLSERRCSHWCEVIAMAPERRSDAIVYLPMNHRHGTALTWQLIEWKTF